MIACSASSRSTGAGPAGAGAVSEALGSLARWRGAELAQP